MRIGDCLSSRENSFDFLRFFAASMVVFSHSYILFGDYYNNEPLGRLSLKESFGSLAVAIFFTMSGLLIAKSWIERPKIFTFVWNRLLRIYPGYALAIAFAIFIVGPLATTRDLWHYFKDNQTIEYAKGVFMHPVRFALPGVFENSPYPSVVNGSLWTLPMEMIMYVGVMFFGIFGFYKRKSFPAVLAFTVIACYFLTEFSDMGKNVFFFLISLDELLKYGSFFSIGMCAYVYREYIVLNKWIAFGLMLIWILSFKSRFMAVTTLLAIPYAVFNFGLRPNKLLKAVSRYGDFSYGMYVYAFPVQQLTAHYFKDKMSFVGMLVLSYLVTLVLGAISWHLVEKRALKFKKAFTAVA